MGNRVRSIAIIIIYAVFIIVPVVAQDDLPPEGNIVVVDSAFVRSGPGNDYTPVGALFAGNDVFPVNISEDGLWLLIPYSRGNGWIQRNLVRWEDNAALNLLPVFPANVTPTPRIAVTNTPFVPTATPEGNYVNVDGAASAYVRAGPGRGYLRLGQLLPGETVEALARNEETSWIMIRYSDEFLVDGFGWLAVELIYWEDFEALEELPLIDIDNLTPTITFTPSSTATITVTASTTATSTATELPTETETALPSATPTDIPTETALPTDTVVPTETSTATELPTETETALPSATATDMPTETALPTDTLVPSETSTATELPTETETALPSATSTDVPTETALPTDTPVPSETVQASDTSTAIVSVAVATSGTEVFETPTEAMTDIFAIQETSVAAGATENASRPPDPAILEEAPLEDDSGSIPLEAIVGIILLLLILTYIWFYWQGLAATGRYADGFIIEECPVCHQGHLQMDERQSRTFGIPSVRRTIRCDVCRSVLRETGSQRWRYAVDRIENATMYDRFNGRQVSDTDLERLAKTPPDGARARTSPEFDEGESEK